MISVDIKKEIRTFYGVDTLSVKGIFPERSITQVVGISGAGKTTFLKMLAGLIKPDGGSIKVGDKYWVDVEKKQFLTPQDRKVGFVFQDYALFPNLTVREHLLYGTNDQTYIDELLNLGRMSPYQSHKPRQLSGGQQQRVAILRALVTRPHILLMDEPFSALDKGLKEDLIQNLKTLITQQAITCLVVTHDAFAPGQFADSTFEM